jgi:predicted Zn-dependent protease
LTLEEVLHIAAQGEVERVSNYCRHYLEQDEAAAPLILEALAQGYLRYYRLDEAYPILQNWSKRRPEDTQALLFLAGIHVLMRHHPEALALYRQILQLDPDHELARRRLAEILMEDRKHDEAMPLLEQVRRHYPDDPGVQVQLARCHYHLGQQDEAERLLDEVLSQQPHFASALAERGHLALVRGQIDRAEAWLREAMTLDPANRPLRYQLIHCLEQQGKIAEADSVNQQMKQLERDLNRLEYLTIHEITKRPNNSALQHELGQILLNIGQVEEGLRWLHRILQSHPYHRDTHRTLADYYQRAGEAEQAAHHRRFLPNVPSQPEASVP